MQGVQRGWGRGGGRRARAAGAGSEAFNLAGQRGPAHTSDERAAPIPRYSVACPAHSGSLTPQPGVGVGT